jgi:hypothetical protein
MDSRLARGGYASRGPRDAEMSPWDIAVDGRSVDGWSVVRGRHLLRAIPTTLHTRRLGPGPLDLRDDRVGSGRGDCQFRRRRRLSELRGCLRVVRASGCRAERAPLLDSRSCGCAVHHDLGRRLRAISKVNSTRAAIAGRHADVRVQGEALEPGASGDEAGRGIASGPAPRALPSRCPRARSGSTLRDAGSPGTVSSIRDRRA